MHHEWSPERLAGLFARLADQHEAAARLRRVLHTEPRLGGHEEDTTRTLLAELGLAHEPLPEGGALVRVGAADGPAVALRAELDALPVAERTEVPWRSVNDAMHACGHDVHLAAAVAVARTLHAAGAPVPLLLVLQPREEVLPSGARDVVEADAFAAHDVRAVVGVHVQPRLQQRH